MDLHVIGKVVFFHNMGFESMGHFVKILFPDTADETFWLEDKSSQDITGILKYSTTQWCYI